MARPEVCKGVRAHAPPPRSNETREREKEKETARENDRETESTRYSKMWEQALNSALAGDVEKTDYHIIWYTLILYETEPTDAKLRCKTIMCMAIMCLSIFVAEIQQRQRRH